MLPYWLLFALWAAGTLQADWQRKRDPRNLFFFGGCIATTLMIGLRFEIGGDWGAYDRLYNTIMFLPFSSALKLTDAGYSALNWIAAQWDLGIVAVNTVCALVFMAGFGRLAYRQPNPSLAMLVAVPYLIIVVAMGYTRQAAAIGMICFAIADASEKKLFRLVAYIGIGALFHKTAILVLPLALVPVMRRNVIFGIMGAILFVFLFAYFLRDQSEMLLSNYVRTNYDSDGASIRVALNVLAAVAYLFYYRQMDMPPFQKSFWTVCAVSSMLAVIGLVVAAGSSGVDRLSLYFIPLQSVVYSRLPYVHSKDGKASAGIMIGIIGYASIIEFVWLVYASFSKYWLPYDMAFI